MDFKIDRRAALKAGAALAAAYALPARAQAKPTLRFAAVFSDKDIRAEGRLGLRSGRQGVRGGKGCTCLERRTTVDLEVHVHLPFMKYRRGSRRTLSPGRRCAIIARRCAISAQLSCLHPPLWVSATGSRASTGACA